MQFFLNATNIKDVDAFRKLVQHFILSNQTDTCSSWWLLEHAALPQPYQYANVSWFESSNRAFTPPSTGTACEIENDLGGNYLKKVTGVVLLLSGGTFLALQFLNASHDSVTASRIMGITCWVES